MARNRAVDLLETVLVYKLPDLSREEIRTMLHLPDTDLKETRFYREAFAEGEAQGEARGEARGEVRGEARGEARGIMKGKHTGELALVLRLLHRRLGAASTGYEAAIRALSLDHLETLGEDLLDFRSERDLAAWLERHSV
jgi:predicted transposase YdaD